MNKTIEYVIKREIEYLPLIDDFYVYQEKITIGNNRSIINEGITINIIEDIKQEEAIIQSEYRLYREKILGIARNNLFGREDTQKEFEKCLIKKPFTYFKNNGLDDVRLLHVKWYDHSIRDIYGKKLPTAIYFDYIDGSIHNGIYNLEEVLNILKQRNDIRFLQEGIVPIPYYNRDENRSEYLDFIWTPSDEDFEKIAECKDSWIRRNKIINEIFELKEKSKNKKYKLKR